MFTTRSRVALFVLSTLALVCCGDLPELDTSRDPSNPTQGDGGGQTTASSAIASSVTSSSSGTGGKGECGEGSACNGAEDCQCLQVGNECIYADCFKGACTTFPRPEANIDCETDSYPWKICEAGACVEKKASPNCISAVTDGTVATGCDDGNPCTVDEVIQGVCNHFYIGIGFACGDSKFNDGKNMQCWSGGSGNECCPVPPASCTKIGEKAECADGSVCMEGRCFVACDPLDPSHFVQPGACAGTIWPTCVEIRQGFTTRYVCQ